MGLSPDQTRFWLLYVGATTGGVGGGAVTKWTTTCGCAEGAGWLG